MQRGLGEMEYMLGNRDKAVEWWKKAQESYKNLGDIEQVQKLEEWIKDNL